VTWDIPAAIKGIGDLVSSIFNYKSKKLDAEPRKRHEAQIDQIRKERDEEIRTTDNWADKP
jgi:hypothetical protein